MLLQPKRCIQQNSHLIKKRKVSSLSILVQVNGRLIGSELFNISTSGGAVKKGYISAQGLYSSRDLCKSKWAASVKVHVPPFMRSTLSPSSFLRSCSRRPCGSLKSSWLEASSSKSPPCWRLQINLQCLCTYLQSTSSDIGWRVHSCRLLLQRPNIQRRLIWSCRFLQCAASWAKQRRISMRGCSGDGSLQKAWGIRPWISFAKNNKENTAMCWCLRKVKYILCFFFNLI